MITVFLALLVGFLIAKLNMRQKIVIKEVDKKQTNSKPQFVPINVSSRGVEHFQQIGILYDGNEVLPLLGRPTYRGSHKWNYYTLTNNAISIKIPLVNKGNVCLDNNGCDELYEGDKINIPEYNNQQFTVKIYDRSPRYLPNI